MTNSTKEGSILGTSRSQLTGNTHDTSAADSTSSPSDASAPDYISPTAFQSNSGENKVMDVYSDYDEDTQESTASDSNDMDEDSYLENELIEANMIVESEFSQKVGALMMDQLQPVQVPAKSITENEFLTHLAAKGFSINAERFLGEGSFAKVFGALYRPPCNSNNEETKPLELQLAAKVIQLDKMCHEFRTLHFPRELHVLRGLKHEFIVQVFHIELNPLSSLAVIFQELAVCDLEDYTADRYVGEAQMLVWFRQIASALDYCHNIEGVAHRDIKLANLLLFANGCVKLTDFGFAMPAIHVDTGEVIYSGNRYSIGTRMYNAPEIVNHEPYNPFQTDVWSLGVVLYTTVQNRFPFNHDLNRKSLHTAMMTKNWSFRSKYPLSHQLKLLIISMLEPNSAHRATMTYVMAHPWLSSDVFIQLPPPHFKEDYEYDGEAHYTEIAEADANNNNTQSVVFLQ